MEKPIGIPPAGSSLTPPQPAMKKARKVWRRIGIGLGSLIFILVILFVFFPTIFFRIFFFAPQPVWDLSSKIIGRQLGTASLTDSETSVNKVRQALVEYANANEKQYPGNLEVLAPTYTSTKDLTDPVTGKTYPYTSTGTSYRLSYTIQLSKIKDKILREVYSDQYVDGVNTATDKMASREAEDLKDTDQDGLSDAREIELRTDVYHKDSDYDGKTDAEEVQAGTDPLANPDPDGDGLTNEQEAIYHSDPNVADTDGDQVPDGQEVQKGTDPTKPGKLGYPAYAADTSGQWSGCVDIRTIGSCSQYCLSQKKTCSNTGMTSDGYFGFGYQCWDTLDECRQNKYYGSTLHKLCEIDKSQSNSCLFARCYCK